MLRSRPHALPRQTATSLRARLEPCQLLSVRMYLVRNQVARQCCSSG